MEARKAGANLQKAYMANLHCACQALYNMYNWMVRAERQETFFRTVRVFSFVFDADAVCIWIHRAQQLPIAGEPLKFCFDEFAPPFRFTKDRACLLVKTILADYAASELHPALKNAFVEIVNQEEERIASKRKTSAALSESMKRVHREQSTEQPFNMANLS
jgi:hypothetical protein